MNSGWQRWFVFFFLACVVGSLTYSFWPSAENAPKTPGPDPRPHPRLAYWFWTPEILKKNTYLEQARDLARRGSYTLAFATPRYPHTGVDFMDVDRFAPLFKKTVAALEEHGVGLGLDLRFYLGVNRNLPTDEQQGVVERVDIRLDAQGRGSALLPPDPILFEDVARSAGSRVLAVYRWRESLERVTVDSTLLDGGTLRLDCGAPASGATVHALLLRTYNHPDMFSPAYPEAFEAVLTGYRDVGLKGVGLDEFAYLPLRTDRWRTALYYSPASAERFRETYRDDLVDAIARMLAGPPGPERIRAAFRYHEHHRRAISAVEGRFYESAKRILGADTFIGVHPTNQTLPDYNDLERSLTFLDWWAVRRDFGQTDEFTPMAVRMALALKANGRVWYNMFYDPDPARILDEIARCAMYGGRVHYHAYNDAHYGYPLEKDDWLATLAGVQQRLAALDRISWLGVPEIDTLVIFGWPWLMTAPTPSYRQTMNFLNRLWDRGYRCAAVPSYEVADGALRCWKGLAHYGTRRFRRVVVYQPEFADPITIRFFKKLVESPQIELHVVGKLTTDARGRSVPWGASLERYCTTENALLKTPGPAHDEPLGGVRYPWHRRVFVDRRTLETGKLTARTVRSGGKTYRFAFAGVLVLEMKPGEPPKVLARGEPE